MPPDDTTDLTPASGSPPESSPEADAQTTPEPPAETGPCETPPSPLSPSSPSPDADEPPVDNLPEEDYLFDEEVYEEPEAEDDIPDSPGEARDETGTETNEADQPSAVPAETAAAHDSLSGTNDTSLAEEPAPEAGRQATDSSPAAVTGSSSRSGKKLGWIGAWKKLRKQRAHEPPGGREQDFMEHLAELRDRLIKIIILVCLGATLCWSFYDRQVHFVVLEGPENVLLRCRVYLVSEGKQTPREPTLKPLEGETATRIARLERRVQDLQERIAELERRTGVSALTREREPLAGRRSATGPAPSKSPAARKIRAKLVIPSLWGFITGPVRQPLEAKGVRTVFQNPLEPLLVRFQVVVVAGIVLLSPAIFYQIWAFVWPALYTHERKAVGPLVPASFLLFILGVALAYKVIPVFFLFLLGFATGDSEVFNFVKWYIPFLAKVCLSMGIVFEMPVVFWILGKLGIVGAQVLLKYWRHAIVIIFIIAAIITPTWDPFNLCLLAVPICALYFLSVFLVWVAQRSREREEEAA